MALDRILVDILAETVDAFSTLDLEKLHALERRIGLLVESNMAFAGSSHPCSRNTQSRSRSSSAFR